MTWISISGDMASGKSTLASRLAENFGLRMLSFGDLVRAEAARRGVGLDRQSLQDLGQHLFEDLGPDRFVAALLGGQEVSYVVDGVRHLAVLDALRRRQPSLLSVYLTADSDALDRRWSSRGDAGARSDHQIHQVESESLQLRDVVDLRVGSARLSVNTLASLVITAARGLASEGP